MAHHRRVSDVFTYTVSTTEHSTGIAIVSYPLKVEPNQEFEVEIAVLCLTKGCDLMGKTIGVGTEPGRAPVFTGRTTWKAFNAKYGKWEYHGKVKCKAPEALGSYNWYGVFPYQSRHRRAEARIGI